MSFHGGFEQFLISRTDEIKRVAAKGQLNDVPIHKRHGSADTQSTARLPIHRRELLVSQPQAKIAPIAWISRRTPLFSVTPLGIFRAQFRADQRG